MNDIYDYYNRRQQQVQQIIAPQTEQPQTEQPQPQVDTNDAINSVAAMMGPTPAEREVQLDKAEKNRRKMAMWTALFDGMRHLGNLYYTSKGAAPQQLNSMMPIVEQNYQRERQRIDDMTNYRRQYAQQLYQMQRQRNEDARKKILADAQANYYDTRDEVARMKAENERLKTEKYVELQDGRIAKINAETGQIIEMLPYKKQEAESRISRNRASANLSNTRAANVGAPVTTERTVEGNVTKTVKTTGTKPSKTTSTKLSGKGKTKNRKPQTTTSQKIATGVKWK